MRRSYPATYDGQCVRCRKSWKQGAEIGTVRRCLLFPPESRASMTSAELGETVRLCVDCAREVSR